MRTRPLALTVLTAWTILACHQPTPPTQPAATPVRGDSVTLQRTQCYGTCAAYVVTIGDGGAVLFTTKGGAAQRTTIASSGLGSVLTAIDTAGFFTMPSYAESTAVCRKALWTDFPSAIVTAAYHGRTHTVEHYLGCAAAPKMLSAIEHMIDSVAGSSGFLKGHFGEPYGSTFMRSP